MPKAKRSPNPIAISPTHDKLSGTPNNVDKLSFEDIDLWIIYKALRLYEPIPEEQQRYDLMLRTLDKIVSRNT